MPPHLRHQLIMMFLEHGANIDDILLPLNPGHKSSTWLEETLLALQAGFDISHIGLSLEIMLKHGLNPNASLGDSKVWQQLLHAISMSLSCSFIMENKVVVYAKILTCFLQYGADPYSRDILDIFRSLEGPDLPKLEQLVQQEQKFVQSRERHLKHSTFQDSSVSSSRTEPVALANSRGRPIHQLYCAPAALSTGRKRMQRSGRYFKSVSTAGTKRPCNRLHLYTANVSVVGDTSPQCKRAKAAIADYHYLED